MNQPLVTCLCLTMAGRESRLSGAIDCFCRQTYPNRELLIVGDSWDVIESIAEGPISYLKASAFVRPAGQCNIGQKRNLGCESAAGDLIAIWDDDDFSAPDRLDFQVKSFEINQKSVTGFQLMKFTDGANWWQFCLGPGQVFGSSLCFTREWWKANPFPEINVGEDAGFCERAASTNQLALCPDVDLMYSNIHPGNTSKKKVHEPGWMALPGFQWPGR